ncbi:MAG: hypothetical protein ACQEQ0_11665, partial [Bacteroidota bacterium]
LRQGRPHPPAELLNGFPNELERQRMGNRAGSVVPGPVNGRTIPGLPENWVFGAVEQCFGPDF